MKYKNHSKFKLTRLQQDYYFGQMTTADTSGISTDGVLQVCFEEIDYVRLEGAINNIVQKHDMLRAVAIDEVEACVLSEHPYVTIKRFTTDKDKDKVGADTLFSNIQQRNFHATQLPGFSFTSLEGEGDGVILFFHFSLFFVDLSGWIQFVQEIITCYQSSIPVQSDAINDFNAFYQVESDSLQPKEQDSCYWKSLDLKPSGQSIEPILEKARSLNSSRFLSQSRLVSNRFSEALRLKLSSHHVSETTFFCSIFALVISRWCGIDQLPLNLVASHRARRKFKGIGNYGAPFPVSFNFKSSNTIIDLLKVTQLKIRKGLKHQTPFLTTILRALDAFNQSSGALFPVVFTPAMKTCEDFGLTALERGGRFIKLVSKTPQVWLDNQIFKHRDGGYVIKIDYVDQFFSSDLIMALLEACRDLTERLAMEDWNNPLPHIALPKYDLQLIESANYQISNETKHFILTDWCRESFTTYAQKDAVVDRSGNYSYNFIQCFSYQLAKRLPNKHLIAVLSKKGYQQVVGILGTLFAGSAYLPLNVSWPNERIKRVLEQGGATYVLVSREQYHRVSQIDCSKKSYRWIIIEDVYGYLDEAVDIHSLVTVQPHDLAYVIFTSGSTGVPKGVAISHHGVVNTIVEVNKKFSVSSRDKVLALSELSFDLSVYDIFGMLFSGGTLIFPDHEKRRDPEEWARLISHYDITVWNSVPQIAELFLPVAEKTQKVSTLRLFLLSGDWLPLSLPDAIRHINPDAKVISLGGATEASIWSVWYDIKSIDGEWSTIPYGTAMPNQKIYILNNFGQHCPIGVLGELYIGGAGVAMTYWNDPVKTARCFIHHETLGRLYKTGDFARWHKNGYVEFRGRKDDQVKINGYRVELGGIEACLLKFQGVLSTCVVIHRIERRKPGSSQNVKKNVLAAYFTAKHQVDQSQLQHFLSLYLPDYMLPKAFVQLEAFPLTINGKLDRYALPLPSQLDDQSDHYIAPRSSLETTLCDAVQKLFDFDQPVGIHDDFFERGGDSFSAVAFVSSLRSQGISCDIADLFVSKTMVELAELISRREHSGCEPKMMAHKLELFNYTPYEVVDSSHTKRKQAVFLFPPGRGGPESYYGNIAARLKPYKVFLFNNLLRHLRSNGHAEVSNIDIEKLADYYFDYVVKLQDSGAYVLFGWSVGGVLALEVAKRLRKKGKNVSRVILMDSYFSLSKALKLSGIDVNEKQYQSVQQDINVSYSAENPVSLSGTKIILYKATEVCNPDVYTLFDKEQRSVFAALNTYYTATKDNHLSDYVCAKDITVKPYLGSYFSWTLCPEILEMISNDFDSLLLSNEHILN